MVSGRERNGESLPLSGLDPRDRATSIPPQLQECSKPLTKVANVPLIVPMAGHSALREEGGAGRSSGERQEKSHL